MKFDWSHAGIFRLVVTAIAIAMAIYHMWAIAFGSPEAFFYRGTHLMFAMVLVLLLYRTRSRTDDAALIEAAGEAAAPAKVQPPSLFDYVIEENSFSPRRPGAAKPQPKRRMAAKNAKGAKK